MITLSSEVKGKLGIEAKSVKYLEKFLSKLNEESKVYDEFTLDFLLKNLSKSRVMELIEHRVLVSKNSNFILSFIITNFIRDTYEVTDTLKESGAPSRSLSPPQEGVKMAQYPVITSYEDSLRFRQLKALERNLNIPEQALLDKLLNNKELRATFGFEKQWLICLKNEKYPEAPR